MKYAIKIKLNSGEQYKAETTYNTIDDAIKGIRSTAEVLELSGAEYEIAIQAEKEN